MYVIDPTRFRTAMREKGYRSIGELARVARLHRNTVHYYLSGHRALPAGLEKICETLGREPSHLLTPKAEFNPPPVSAIASTIDTLHTEFPGVTFVLFGSRPQGRAHPFSDWDIGVFARQGLPHPLYRQIRRRAKDLEEDLPFSLDVVNLNRADPPFLRAASRGWSFLAGSQQDWVDLQRRAHS